MGLRHRTMKIEGVQFHPESIMTAEGKKLLANFLKVVNRHLANRLAGGPCPPHSFRTPDKSGSKQSAFNAELLMTGTKSNNFLPRLMRDENLSRAEAAQLLNWLLDGSATDAQIAATLIALKRKGETV